MSVSDGGDGPTEPGGSGPWSAEATAVTDPLDAALDVLRQERRRCTDEREAFRTFAARVRRLDPETADVARSSRFGVGGPDSVPAASQASAAVRTAYTETVRAVPHYDHEYDETLAESLTAEFGVEVANALVAGNRLSPALQAAVVRGAEAARLERTQFVARLDRERTALSTARESVTALLADLQDLDRTPLSEQGFDELRALYGSISDLRGRCDRLTAERQSAIDRLGRTADDPHLQEYVYQSEPYTYPVLTTLVDVGVLVDRARRRVCRQLTVTV